MEAYGMGMGKKWADIEKRLKEGKPLILFILSYGLTFSVRMRGRKRDMTG